MKENKFEIGEGKYTLQEQPSGELTALRYGEPWRYCSDDLVITTLFAKLKFLSGDASDVDFEVIKVDEKQDCSMSLSFDNLEIWQENAGRLCAKIGDTVYDVCGDNLVYNLTVEISKLAEQKTELHFC